MTITPLSYAMRCHYRRFGLQQRHCLTLHVRTHERAVGVVVFKERNKACCHGYELFGAYVHIVYHVAAELFYVLAVTAGDALLDKPAVFVQQLVCLRDDKAVLPVRREILDFVGNHLALLVHAAVRAFHKAVFVDSCKRRQ